MRKKTARLTLLLAILAAPSASAATFTVSTNADSGAGSLRQAIDDLNSAGAGSHAIAFNASLGAINLASDLADIVGTGQTVIIDGAGNTIDAQSAAQIFSVSEGTVTINDLSLLNGQTTGSDGVYNTAIGSNAPGLTGGGTLTVGSASNVTLNNVTVDSGSTVAGNGGGAISMAGDGGSATGAAVVVLNGGSLDVVNGTFTGNTVQGGAGGGATSIGGDGGNASGGAIYVQTGGDLSLTDSVLSGNSASGGNGGNALSIGGSAGSASGGAVFVESGATIAIVDSSLSGNSAVAGGGGTGAVSGSAGSASGNGMQVGSGVVIGFEVGSGQSATTDAIGGEGGLEKTGAGTLTLSEANTYTGGTTVSAGTLTGSTTSIQGSITNNAAVQFDQSTNGTYSGVITGTGSVTKAGTGNVTLSGANNYTGGTTVGAGTLTGSTTSLQGSITNNAAVQFDQSTNGTYSGVISGTGSLTKAGTGNVTLSGGNTYTGDTNANAGRLAINGSIAGNAIVGASGELGGSGTVGGNLTNNGTLAAGNSIGTLTVSGDASFGVGSSTEIEIQGSSTPVAGTDGDLIASGTATISGGTVSVDAAAGTYSHGAQYTFLQTTTGLTGTFASIQDNLTYYDAQLGYTANSAYFTLSLSHTDFQTVGGSGNLLNVGTYIDQHSPGATGDFASVLDELLGASVTEARSGLRQLSGEVYASQSQVAIQGTSQMIGTIGGQLRMGLMNRSRTTSGFAPLVANTAGGAADSASEVSLVSFVHDTYTPTSCDSMLAEPCLVSHQWRGWLTGYGAGGAADGDGTMAGVDYGLGGTSFGIERELESGVRLGYFGGYVGTSVASDGMDQSVRSSGGNFGSYLTHVSDDQYGLVLGGIQLDAYDSERTIQVGGLDRTAEGDFDGWQAFAYGERGMNFRFNDLLAFQPFAGLQYVAARQNAYTETGAGAVNLAVSRVETFSLRSNLGARLLRTARKTKQGWMIAPEIRASWMHEFLDTSSLVNARFASIGGTGFTANGLDLGRDWVVVGGGFSLQPNNRWEFRADYDTMANEHQVLHIGSGMLSYAW